MRALTRIVDKGLSWSLILLMSIMVATVSWQVATRYILDSPSSYTEELATYLLIWISLLGGRLRASVAGASRHRHTSAASYGPGRGIPSRCSPTARSSSFR